MIADLAARYAESERSITPRLSFSAFAGGGVFVLLVLVCGGSAGGWVSAGGSAAAATGNLPEAACARATLYSASVMSRADFGAVLVVIRFVLQWV